MEIRPLSASDVRDTFRSGDPDLERFFSRFAGQNQFRHHLGTTYVAVDTGRILGYVTVAAGQVEAESIREPLRRKLPRYSLPVLRLARLAVDESARSRGLGKALLRFTFTLALQMSRDFGCVGVLVDAKPHAVAFYARYGFETIAPILGAAETRPTPETMFLPLLLIEQASNSSL
ncbi:MAG: GNAT family N-acetyltransferase [Candidatus Wallbacteria bacterium]|nr:GNAT family N-acetyltransferase [Candidatus Wallbacteria bacterium]